MTKWLRGVYSTTTVRELQNILAQCSHEILELNQRNILSGTTRQIVASSVVFTRLTEDSYKESPPNYRFKNVGLNLGDHNCIRKLYETIFYYFTVLLAIIQ